MTGLGNCRHAASRLSGLQPGDGMLFDLDQFKQVSDRDSHAAGDVVLCQFARYLIRALRGQDTAARYGGEEFLVVLHQAGDASVDVTERLNQGWWATNPRTTCQRRRRRPPPQRGPLHHPGPRRRRPLPGQTNRQRPGRRQLGPSLTTALGRMWPSARRLERDASKWFAERSSAACLVRGMSMITWQATGGQGTASGCKPRYAQNMGCT